MEITLKDLSDGELQRYIIETSNLLRDLMCERERREELPKVEPNSQTKILVLDLETTGFLKDGGKIVEIGCVELNLKNGKIKKLFGSVCREEGMTAKDREAWIFKNSSLTIEDVRSAPMLEVMKPALQELFDYYPCTAFNRQFDIPFLESRGFVFKQLAPCPMVIATDVLKIPNPYTGQHKWPSVTECFKYFFPQREYNEAHRGPEDAHDEAEIVYELYKLGFYKV